MSRTFRLLTCLLLILALTAAPATLASSPDNTSEPWWSAFSDLWSMVFAAAFEGDDNSNGGEIDPNGTVVTTSSNDDGNMGPEIDPNGLTINLDDDGCRGAEAPNSNHGGKTTPEIDPNG